MLWEGKRGAQLEPCIRPPSGRLMCECSQQKEPNNNVNDNDYDNVDNNIKVNPK